MILQLSPARNTWVMSSQSVVAASTKPKLGRMTWREQSSVSSPLSSPPGVSCQHHRSDNIQLGTAGSLILTITITLQGSRPRENHVGAFQDWHHPDIQEAALSSVQQSLLWLRLQESHLGFYNLRDLHMYRLQRHPQVPGGPPDLHQVHQPRHQLDLAATETDAARRWEESRDVIVMLNWPDLTWPFPGNARAGTFFRSHNCNTRDSQQKYNSRAASMYRDKLSQDAVKAMRMYGDKVNSAVSV